MGEFSGTVHDLSLNGVSVACAGPLPLPGPCVIVLLLDGGASPIRIRATGAVVRVDGDRAAVRIEGVDPDDVHHLTNLVLYNAPDAGAFEDEAESGALRRPPLRPVE